MIAPQTALIVDSALYRTVILNNGYRPGFRAEPEATVIGIVETRPYYFGKAMWKKQNGCNELVRSKKMTNDAGFVGHEEGYTA